MVSRALACPRSHTLAPPTYINPTTTIYHPRPPAPCRYAGDEDGRGGIYNFVTKRGICLGDHSKISWTQVSLLC